MNGDFYVYSIDSIEKFREKFIKISENLINYRKQILNIIYDKVENIKYNIHILEKTKYDLRPPNPSLDEDGKLYSIYISQIRELEIAISQENYKLSEAKSIAINYKYESDSIMKYIDNKIHEGNIFLKNQIDLMREYISIKIENRDFSLQDESVNCAESSEKFEKNNSNRYNEGIASFDSDLKYVDDSDTKWMKEGNIFPIPKQIAERLSGKKFRNFNHLRENIWKEIALDDKINYSFSISNLLLLKRGRSPVCNIKHYERRRRYELDHLKEIREGGEVMNLSNIVIREPVSHVVKTKVSSILLSDKK